jgi:hypothetical protein
MNRKFLLPLVATLIVAAVIALLAIMSSQCSNLPDEESQALVAEE